MRASGAGQGDWKAGHMVLSSLSPSRLRGAQSRRQRRAIAIQVVDRVDTVEHDRTEFMRRVAESPAACRRVLRTLTQLARDGVLTTDPKWDSTVTAFRGLNDAMYAPPRTQRRRW